MNHLTPRAIVIEHSVHLEKNISGYLCLLLDIDMSVTKLFGANSAAMGFDTRLSLLLELKYLTDIKKNKFKAFAEVRNKFAHIADVIS